MGSMENTHPASTTFLCAQCDTRFDTAEARMAHRVETGHRSSQERFGGRRVTAPTTVSADLAPAPAPSFRRAVSVESSVRPAGGTSSGPAKASDPSKRYLRALLSERSGERVEQIRAEANAARERGFLSQRAVSEWIDALKGLPKAEVAAPAPVAPAAPAVRTNRFAQKCEDCGTMVPEGEGILVKADSGRWEVSHRDGECPASAFPFPMGRYAIENGEGDLRFYVVSEDGLFVQASDDLHRVHPSGQAAVIEAIAVDPRAAAIRYGQEIGACGRCNRTLTSEWRKVGLGPVCSKKGW